MPDEKLEKSSITLPESLLRRIDRVAGLLLVTRSAIIERLCSGGIASLEDEAREVAKAFVEEARHEAPKKQSRRR